MAAQLMVPSSPLWTRRLSDAPANGACADLEAVLAATGAHRMVVGHTVQPSGIRSACDGRLWRIDVGMARFFRKAMLDPPPIQALQLDADGAHVLVSSRE